MKKLLSTVAMACAAALALAGCGSSGGSSGSDQEGLPKTMVWSTYGTATSTYADTAAVADAVSKKAGSQIRVITSDTAVGRMTPLKQGQALFQRGGDEYIYAFEADYDFAVEEWGPQDILMAWAPTAPHGFLVKDDSDIKDFADLKGKKVPWATANPSVQNKVEALLAYGGLTWDDVTKVDITYGDQAEAMNNGQIDVVYQQVYGSSLFELESKIPVRWLDMTETEGPKADAVEEIAPSTHIGPFENAPGQEEGESANGIYYTVPMSTYAKTSEEDVYSLGKALTDAYDDYKDVTATTKGWGIDEIQREPTQVPFHPGYVKFLKENDAWTDEAEKKNQELLDRGEKLREEWTKYTEQADGNISYEDWKKWKDEHVPQS